MGVATAEMSHRVEIGDAVTWAWCAFDPLFIMPLVGRTARVSSPCPVTGQMVSLTVTPDAVVQVHPAGAAVSSLIPDRPFDADVLVTFCHYVMFCASRDAGERWSADHPGTFLLSVDEAADLGRRTARAAFPQVPVAPGSGQPAAAGATRGGSIGRCGSELVRCARGQPSREKARSTPGPDVPSRSTSVTVGSATGDSASRV